MWTPGQSGILANPQGMRDESDIFYVNKNNDKSDICLFLIDYVVREHFIQMGILEQWVSWMVVRRRE